MKVRSLRLTQIIYSVVVAIGVILLSIIISFVLLKSLRRTTEDKISYFISADAHQMELNVDNYFNNVQQVTALLFSDKGYYLYDATDTSLSEYQKIQSEELILNTYAEHRAGCVLNENLCNCTSQAADDGVLFASYDTACLLGSLDDCILIDRLDRVHIEKSCIDTLALEDIQNLLRQALESERRMRSFLLYLRARKCSCRAE